MHSLINRIIITYVILMSFSLSLSAQEEAFTIKGKVGSLNLPATIYFLYQSGGSTIVDSAQINKGNFQFSGKAEHATKGTLLLSRSGKGMRTAHEQLTIYLEKGMITISTPDSFISPTITGSPINTDYLNLLHLLKPVGQKSTALRKSLNQLPSAMLESDSIKRYTEESRTAIREEQRNVLLSFIKVNNKSPIALLALRQYGGNYPEVNTVEPLFEILDESVKNSHEGKIYAQQLKNTRSTDIGNLAPSFTQTDVDGKLISLADFKGKYLLIDFWASWCVPCRRENPNILAAYNAFKDKNFTVLGISLDDNKSRDKWVKAILEDQLSWTQVSDLKGGSNEVAVKYGVRVIPQNYLVDPNGYIVAKNLRGDALIEKLKELLEPNF